VAITNRQGAWIIIPAADVVVTNHPYHLWLGTS
jgi:hypothetical protein